MDFALIENGNGGELVKQSNDFAIVEGWTNMIYLALFGGNVEAVTKIKVLGEQNFDWWANNLLMPSDSSVQFNSLTEKALMGVALNSAGRAYLEKVVKQDLAFMADFANIKVVVSIEGVDRVRIEIQVRQPNVVQNAYRAYIYIWDATKQQLGDFSILDFNDDFFV
jgi:hypothetical protein